MELQIKTLTPLWTGGVETGRMDRLHETGIIGSLRWWYEAILRGLGAYVCDPTSDTPEYRCQFDTDAYQKALREGQDKSEAMQAGLQNVCPVCRLFGCTGWKRRFNLSIEASPNLLTPFWLATLDKQQKSNHWWLSQVFKTDNNKVYLDDSLTLQARFIRGYEHYEEVLKALLSLMANYGAIGSRTQYGFGQFAYPDAYSPAKSMGILRQQAITLIKTKKHASNFYSLQDFWCLQCQIPSDDERIKEFHQKAYVIGDKGTFEQYKNRCLPVSFDIRYKLPRHRDYGMRQAYRLAEGKRNAQQFFGTVQDKDRWGSRVFVSHLYKRNDKDRDYQLRVWGFTKPELMTNIEESLRNIFPSSLPPEKSTGPDLLCRKE